jgi:WD40 repeat protein
MGHQYLPGSSVTGTLVSGTSTAVVSVDDGSPVVLDLVDGAVENRLPAGSAGRSILASSSDGRVVARVSWTGDLAACSSGARAVCAVLTTFAAPTGRPASPPIAIRFAPSGVALNADGSVVAVAGGPDGAVTWFRTADGARLGGIPGVPAAAPFRDDRGEFRFDGRYDTAAVTFGRGGTLYVGSMAGLVRAVDWGTAAVIGSTAVPPLSSESYLLTTPEGLLLGGGRDGLVALDTATMTRRFSFDTRGGVHPETCPWLAIAPSTERLYCGNYYGVIQERDLATGVPTGVVLDPQLGSVGSLHVTSDGRELVAFGAESGAVSRWRLDGSGPVTRIVAPGHVVYDGFDSTGSMLLVASRPDDATVWDDFQSFAVWDPVADNVVTEITDAEGLGWVGDGILMGLFPAEGRLAYWDSATGAVVDGDQVPLASVRGWSSAGGRRLYVGFPSGEVWTVDPVTRRRLGPVIQSGGSPASVSATSDGRRVFVTAFGPGGVRTAAYDGTTGRRLARGMDGVTLSSVSVDGILVGATGGQITQYDAETLMPVATFTAARGEINSLQFSRDATVLLATSNDQTISVYDVGSGIRLGDPVATAAPLIVPGFLHPDGTSFAATAREGVALWDLDPRHLLVAACRTAGRNLTRSEWATYLADLGPYRSTC